MSKQRTRATLVALTLSLAMIVTPQVGSAVPPPPPNPSDDELQSGRADVRAAAQRVGQLANHVAAARAALTDAQIELAATYDEVTESQRAERAAQRAAETARDNAERARADADRAGDQITIAREQADEFIAASFRQGSTVGSLTAYVGSDNPKDVLARAQLLDSVGGAQRDTVEAMQRARIEKSNLDAAARAALQEAEDTQRRAEEATEAAEQSYGRAVRAQQAAKQRTEELLERHQELRREHDSAQRTLDELQGKRTQYENWQVEREAERERERQRRAAERNQAAPPAQNQQTVSTGNRGSAGVVAPTYGRITSTYGPRWGFIHYGLDIANSIGTPIVSVMPGTVINSGPARGFGLWVRVKHDNGVITVYGHNDRNLVSVGQRVNAGQQIATIGNRGESTGPHLHFEVQVGGKKIDPLIWLRGNGVTI